MLPSISLPWSDLKGFLKEEYLNHVEQMFMLGKMYVLEMEDS